MHVSHHPRIWILLTLLGATATGATSEIGIPPQPEPVHPASTTTHFDHGNPTAHEQLMLELVNRARANPGAEAARLGIGLNDGLQPGTIQDTPKQPLALHPLLTAAARAHSQWMLETDTFSHTGVGGSNPGARMSAAGYPFSGSSTWGENIGWGGSTGPIHPTAQTFSRHEGLFRSPGHRVNIVNGSFDEIGLGILEGTFTVQGTDYNALMATQKFAASAGTPGPLLLGVVFRDLNGNGFYDPGEGIGGVDVTLSSGPWHTTTAASGGYAVPYPTGSGTLQVAFTGGPLFQPQVIPVTRTGRNIKVDLDLANLVAPLEFVPGSLQFTAIGSFMAEVSGPPGTVFTLEHSNDLATWVPVRNYTIGGNGVTSINHQPPAGAASFYRLSR